MANQIANKASDIIETNINSTITLDSLLDELDTQAPTGGSSELNLNQVLVLNNEEAHAMIQEVSNNQVLLLVRLAVRVAKAKETLCLAAMDAIAKQYIMKPNKASDAKAFVDQPNTFPKSYLENKLINPDNKALDTKTWSKANGFAYRQLPSKVWNTTYSAFLLGQSDKVQSSADVSQSRKFKVFSLGK